ncbi:EamA-like transporter family protein [Nitzschia inconspicua]|uniref:EamA-like transporter family protein n=1 Tax=Nitzschia inconspicua TaxID=303405 RepID=A0A9K3L2W8_9STRA|nr:EamA-like transporter family protein [Nitzschia inconspicua]
MSLYRFGGGKGGCLIVVVFAFLCLIHSSRSTQSSSSSVSSSAFVFFGDSPCRGQKVKPSSLGNVSFIRTYQRDSSSSFGGGCGCCNVLFQRRPKQKLRTKLLSSVWNLQLMQHNNDDDDDNGSNGNSDNNRSSTTINAKFPNNNNENNESNNNNPNNNKLALAVLMTVPIAWGTFEPAVRLVYQYQPTIPPFLFSFAYYLVATTALNGILLLWTSVDDSNNRKRKNDTFEHNDDNDHNKFDKQPSTDAVAIQGGIELGTYLFVGNALQVIGLKTVPSDKAAFLLQLTTIFVPLFQCLFARNFNIVPIRTWLACVVALFGVAMLGMDGTGTNNDIINNNNINSNTQQVITTTDMKVLWNFGMGELYIILGALFYTFHCIRLEHYAQVTSPIRLAATKATTETVWSGLVLCLCLLLAYTQQPFDSSTINDDNNNNNAVLQLAMTSGNNIRTYMESVTTTTATTTSIIFSSNNSQHWLEVSLATVWTGLVTVAYTIYAQSYGQSRVPATTANLIYSIQPFVTAMIAFIVLNETLGVYGYVGGVMIGVAVLLVVVDNGGGEQ